MFFKGTQRRGVGQLAQETQGAGGFLNAGTIYEHTSYYTVLPSESFEKGMDIQSDALMNCAIDSAELAKEAAVVIQEIKRKLDDPRSYSFEKLLELAFEKHRIRRWRMGYEDQVARWTRDELYDYYRTRYRPENIILSVVGNIDARRTLELIDKYYGDFPRGQLATGYSPAEPPQINFKFKQMTADISRNIVHIGFHAPPVLHEDHYPLAVLDFLLSGGRASRLYQEIKEKRGLAETVTSSYDAFKDVGFFTISAEQNEGDPTVLAKALFEEVERFKIDTVTRGELTRAINQLESAYIHSLEEVNGQAQTYALYESLGDYKLADTYLDRLKDVGAADIQRVANKYLSLENASVLQYLPAGRAPAELAVGEMKGQLAETIEKYRNAYRAPDQSETVITSGTPVGGKRLQDQKIKKEVLANGITVLCRENHSLPIVSAAAYFYGSRSTEDQARAGITLLLAKTSLKGTARMSAAEIASQIEAMGSNVSYMVEDDYFGFTLDGMSKNFEASFSIFADIILNPAFRPEEVEREKADLVAAISRQKDSMAGYPVELCQRALYENHPYGKPSLGDAEAVQKLSQADLIRWHDECTTTGNLVISFVVDITLGEAVELTGNHLARVRQAPRLVIPFPDLAPPLAGSARRLVEQRDKAQTAQAMGFPSCSYTSADYEPMKVIQNIISGMGGRLWTEVRDKRSLAYSVYGYQASGKGAGSFICYLATSPSDAEKAREVILGVLRKMGAQPVDVEELTRARNYTVGTFSIFLQTNAAQADVYARWEIAGRGYEAVDEYPEMIRQVSADQVLAAASKYFDTSRYALGMIEGKSATVAGRE